MLQNICVTAYKRLGIFFQLHQAMNYDFCPWANAYVYWLKKPIGWFVLGLLAAVLLGLYVSPQAYLAAAAIAILIAVGCLWPAIAMVGLRGELSWNTSRCEEGHDVQVSLSVVNRWPWPVWGLVIETDTQVASQANAPGEPISLCRIPAMSRSAFEWTCRPTTRGIFPTQKVRLVTSFPFGIWTRGQDLQVDKKLIVWPKSAKLTDMPERQGRALAIAGALCPKSGHEGDYLGVRPFREGDSLRQVHWAQSARRDSLIVCERQTSSRQQVVLWLDPLASSSCETRDQQETLIRVMASLSRLFSGHSWNVRCVLADQSISLKPGSAPMQVWMDRLAAYQWPTLPELSSSSTIPPETQGDWMVGITTTARVKELEAQCGFGASHFQWILLDVDAHGDRDSTIEIDSRRNDAIVILDCEDFAAQLKAGWQRVCQRAHRIAG